MQSLILFLSWFLVAFGQAAWLGFLGPFAAAVGFALFWFFSLQQPTAKQRFFWGFFWFISVQLVQFSWSVTHPYVYVYALLTVVSLIYGAQFGWITAFITEERLKRLPFLLALSAFWVLNEWIRLHFLLGLPWNTVGLSLATTTLGAQGASLAGVYGLSFLVIFTNLMALRAYMTRQRQDCALFIFLVFLPYLFGWAHLTWHDRQMAKGSEKMRYLLVQTAFPLEEAMGFTSVEAMASFVMGEWQQILSDLAKEKGRKVDLIVLPEYVVPFSTYAPVYRYSLVKASFIAIFGEESLDKLPKLNPHFAMLVDTPEEKEVWMVNNAFWVQSIANLFDTDVLAGLEDRDFDEKGEVTYYSAGILFHPHKISPQRYEKRVLLPLGEYIPFEWCRELCRQYGISGSFTPGAEGKALEGNNLRIGVSICFEEIFGHMMRENRLKGAEVLVNLTNDGWYPHSRLPWQHFEHARLRTVEAGIPLVRACNTGVTSAIDSLGRDISHLSSADGDVENLHGALYVEVSKYTYPTLYTYVGDYMILGICGVAICIGRGKRTKRT